MLKLSHEWNGSIFKRTMNNLDLDLPYSVSKGFSVTNGMDAKRGFAFYMQSVGSLWLYYVIINIKDASVAPILKFES